MYLTHYRKKSFQISIRHEYRNKAYISAFLSNIIDFTHISYWLHFVFEP